MQHIHKSDVATNILFYHILYLSALVNKKDRDLLPFISVT